MEKESERQKEHNRIDKRGEPHIKLMKLEGAVKRKRTVFEDMMGRRKSIREDMEEEQEIRKAQREKEDKKKVKKVEKLKKGQMSVKMMKNWLDTGQGKKPDEI